MWLKHCVCLTVYYINCSPPHTHVLVQRVVRSVHHISTCAASSPYRKKCRALIQGLYDLPLHEVECLLPAKGGSLEVAVLTVPHCPVDGRVDVNVTVYYVNKEPLFFEYNRQWYPTGEDSGCHAATTIANLSCTM